MSFHLVFLFLLVLLKKFALFPDDDTTVSEDDTMSPRVVPARGAKRADLQA